MTDVTTQDIFDKVVEHDEWEREERQIETAISSLGETLSNVRVDVATITERLKSVDDSLVTLNHNSSAMSERMGILEKGVQQNTSFVGFLKRLVAITAAGISVTATIVTILYFLGFI
jgi:hypothetical protein